MKRCLKFWSLPALCTVGVVAHAQILPVDPAGSPQPAPPSASEDPAAPESRVEWRRLGPFQVSPRLGASVIYDDNITIRSATKLDDLIWVVSPGITAIAGDTRGGSGRILTLDYSPSFVTFTDHGQFNTIDHAARLNGIWPFSKLTLGFGQTFDVSSGGVADVGNRIERTTHSTSLTSNYELGGKASFEINARQTIQDLPDNLNSSKQLSNDNWFNYALSSKVSTGLGVTLGYLDPERFSSQTYQQFLARAVYNVTFKVDLTASAGGELRQYGDGGGNTFGPVFTLGGTYWPRDGTSFAIQGHRRNQNSAFLVGQNYVSTGVTLTMRQRVWDRVFASVSGGYDHAAYESARRGVVATRTDHSYTVRTGLDAGITSKWTAGVFYQHRTHESEGAGAFGYSGNQVGLQTSYTF